MSDDNDAAGCLFSVVIFAGVIFLLAAVSDRLGWSNGGDSTEAAETSTTNAADDIATTDAAAESSFDRWYFSDDGKTFVRYVQTWTDATSDLQSNLSPARCGLWLDRINGEFGVEAMPGGIVGVANAAPGEFGEAAIDIVASVTGGLASCANGDMKAAEAQVLAAAEAQSRFTDLVEDLLDN